MVTVAEFNAMTPQQQQETINNLNSQGGEGANNALFLMRYQQEQAGMNTGTPATSINPTQAAQIKETQAYNAAVYQDYQAQQTPSNIVNAPASVPKEVTPLQALTTVAANTSDRAALNEAKEAFYPTDKQVANITYDPVSSTLTASYKANPAPVAASPSNVPAPNILDTMWQGIKDPFSIGKQSLLNNAAQYKDDPTQFYIKQSIKVGGLLSLGAAPVVAGVGAVAGVGISQGIKGIFGGGLLSAKEAEEAFFGGAAFSFVGAEATTALKLTGSGVKAAAGRVGVNTILGAGAGGLYEYAETKQITPIGIGQGAVFGAGLGVVGEVARPVTGRIANRLPQLRTESYNVERLVGAKEIESQVIDPLGIKSQRLTSLQTRTEKVPSSYGKFLLENERFFVPKDLELGGTEKVVMRGGDELINYEKAYLSTRGAEPYVAALKSKNSLDVKGVVVDNLTGERVIVSSSKAPKQVFTQTKIKGKDILGPEKILMERNLSGAKIYGDIDAQVYLKYLKNVPKETGQDWIKQMGGLSYEQLTKPKIAPKNVRVFTDVVGVSKTVAPKMVNALVVPEGKVGASVNAGLSMKSVKVPKIVSVEPLKVPVSKPKAEVDVFNVLPSSRERSAVNVLAPGVVVPKILPSSSEAQAVKFLPGLDVVNVPSSAPSSAQKTALLTSTVAGLPKSGYSVPKLGTPLFDGKFEGRGPNMFYPNRRRGKRGAVRLYPVTDPKKLLEDAL